MGRGEIAKNKWIEAHISRVEGLDAVLVTEPNWTAAEPKSTRALQLEYDDDDAREFDLSDPFVFPEYPLLPLGCPVGHAS